MRSSSMLIGIGITAASASMLTINLLACGEDRSGEGSNAQAGELNDADAAAHPDAGGSGEAQTPCPGRNTLKNPYFGDLHSHTSYSGDAYTFGTRNTPLDAYAFARGAAVPIAAGDPDAGDAGPPITIKQQLDFLAVTDHSEFLAAAFGCGESVDHVPYDPNSPIYDSSACESVRANNRAGIFQVLRMCKRDAGQCEEPIRSAWQKTQEAANASYQRCTFSTFIGYEWTKSGEDSTTLHKNVIFSGSTVPTGVFDSQTVAPTAELLWSKLATECKTDAGCDALTIPHNSNMSHGLAFSVPDAAADITNMTHYQKLAEIFQHKGASECIDTNDPKCDFELLPDRLDVTRDKPGYVREGLKKGLELQRATGANPLAFGIIGATDDHNGAPGNVDEATFPGHAGTADNTPARRIAPGGELRTFNPGGMTVAWAEENTRESIFAAFQRRETYATSGPRIILRFYETFGTRNWCSDPSFPSMLVSANAIPMGGAFASGSRNPSFVMKAWKADTELDRLDIVKAWVDESGVTHDKIISKSLTGADRSAACWVYKDEEATPGPALYYARVLEAQSRRWSSYDCDADPTADPTGCAPDGGELRKKIQERAWSSPIWRTP